ncbi:MAG: aromatic amino acid transport family protein [Patescibacteria group bacterium]|nr:aromatic amino acid transport family protein [Patescibacteria group bacterium]
MGKGSVLATGLLAGTIIGAGIFSLPYVFSRLGILCGVFYLLFFTLVYFVIHKMYAELAETCEHNHQFIYFIKTYLPKFLSKIASFSVLGGLIFVLTVYLILAPTFFETAFGISHSVSFFIFWLFGSLFIFAKLNWMGWAEIAGTISVALIVLIIVIVSFDSPLKTPLFQKLDLTAIFLPFGPLLFSLAGRTAVSKVVEEHRKIKKEGSNFSLKKVIFWGTFIPAIIYFVFIIGVLKLNPQVSPESLNSLGSLSPFLISLLGIMGIITLWTSYFMIGINVKDILTLDLKISRLLAAFITLAVPPFLYFLGIRDFLSAVAFAGSVFVALEALFVIMMWRKAFPQNPWRFVSWPLYLVFVAAIGYEISLIF